MRMTQQHFCRRRCFASLLCVSVVFIKITMLYANSYMDQNWPNLRTQTHPHTSNHTLSIMTLFYGIWRHGKYIHTCYVSTQNNHPRSGSLLSMLHLQFTLIELNITSKIWKLGNTLRRKIMNSSNNSFRSRQRNPG
jgi:hypothetical protein